MQACPQCDTHLDAAPGACPGCGFALHSCRACAFFDVRPGKGCNHEKVTAPPARIDENNDCKPFREVELLPALLRELFAAYQGRPALRKRTESELWRYLTTQPFLSGRSFRTAVADACRRLAKKLPVSVGFDETDVATKALGPLLRQLAKASAADLLNPKFRLTPAFAAYFVEAHFGPHLNFIRHEAFGDTERDLGSLLRAGLADKRKAKSSVERTLAEAAVELLELAGAGDEARLAELVAKGSSAWSSAYDEIYERAQSDAALLARLEPALGDYASALDLLSAVPGSLEGPGRGDDDAPSMLERIAGGTNDGEKVLRDAIDRRAFGHFVEAALARAIADPARKAGDRERMDREVRLAYCALRDAADVRSEIGDKGQYVGLMKDAREVFFAVVTLTHPAAPQRLYERFNKVYALGQALPEYLPSDVRAALAQRHTAPLEMMIAHLAASWAPRATPEQRAEFDQALRDIDARR